MNIPSHSIPVYSQVHTYSDLRQQIHHDLRVQHPEWILPNGESPMCDSYEARLMEVLRTLAPTESNECPCPPLQGPLKINLSGRETEEPTSKTILPGLA